LGTRKIMVGKRGGGGWGFSAARCTAQIVRIIPKQPCRASLFLCCTTCPPLPGVRAIADLAAADGGPAGNTRVVLLSLAEAESLRRALHTRHPTLATPEAPRVVLRMRDGRALDFLQPRTLVRLEAPEGTAWMCCVLCVVCCVLCVVCCMLYVVCCMLCVVCCESQGLCRLPSTVISVEG
jgi:hypothetical protein